MSPYKENMTLLDIVKKEGVTNYRELANFLGVDESYGNLLWNGKRKPTLSIIETLYEKTGTSYEILMALRKDGKRKGK